MDIDEAGRPDDGESSSRRGMYERSLIGSQHEELVTKAARNPATASEGVWRPNSWTHALAIGGLHPDVPDDVALPGRRVLGEPADVDTTVGAGRVDVGLGGVNERPPGCVQEIEHRARTVVGGEPVESIRCGADNGRKEGGRGAHG